MKSQLQDVPIELGGRSLTLRFSIMATVALKERWGLETDREVQAKLAQASISEFIDIVWAGLRRYHPEISHNDVMIFLDDAGVDGLTDIVTIALEASSVPPNPNPQ